MKNVVIFGASSLGECAYRYLQDKENIIAFIDNDDKKWNTELFGIKILSPDRLNELVDTTIVIASMWYKEIVKQIYSIVNYDPKILLFRVAMEELPKLSTSVDVKIIDNAIYSNDIHKQFASYIDKYDFRKGYHVNFLNIATDIRFKHGWHEGIFSATTDIISFPENFLEESCVLKAAINADSTFRMMELGAGYGGWLVMGAVAAKLLGKQTELIGVEGDETHYRWMKQHFLDNGLDTDQHKLIHGVVWNRDGDVHFEVGDEDPSIWYSQWINENKTTKRTIKVRAITLNSLLTESDIIDLIDMDIQGAEFEVMNACDMDLLNHKAKRIYIGTHNRSVENSLRIFFNKLGWNNVHDFEHLRSYTTEFGTIEFNDGVQLWANPNFVK